MEDSPNIIVELSFNFALATIKEVELLQADKHFVIANQLLKAGTSIGANVRESQAAESRQDFIHKMKIAAKEAEETDYWLLLCNKAGYLTNDTLLDKCLSIRKILSKIISSSKNK